MTAVASFIAIPNIYDYKLHLFLHIIAYNTILTNKKKRVIAFFSLSCIKINEVHKNIQMDMIKNNLSTTY